MTVSPPSFNPHGKPEIVNTDQGSQFTAGEFVQKVKDYERAASIQSAKALEDLLGRFLSDEGKVLDYFLTELKMPQSVVHMHGSAREALLYYFDVIIVKSPKNDLYGLKAVIGVVPRMLLAKIVTLMIRRLSLILNCRN